MHHALRNCCPLSRAEFECPVLQINEQSSGDHIKELVVVVVFMPMKFALHDAEAHNAFVYLRERLVPPRILTGSNDTWNVYHFQMRVQNVEVDVV